MVRQREGAFDDPGQMTDGAAFPNNHVVERALFYEPLH
jgi:hypothetical protein